MGFSVTMTGIIVLAVLFVAVAASLTLVMKAYTSAIRSIDEVLGRAVNTERGVIMIKNAYLNATDGLLYVELNNSGSLDLWNFNATDFILIYWDNATGFQSSRILIYGSDWKIAGIFSSNGTLLSFQGHIPPGQTALIEAVPPQGIDFSKSVRIDITNQYGFIASYEIPGGG
ncbi:MAG TPA: hypothetical protein ENO36_04650 [Fervidicoccus fontis]|uniref:Flagellin n=1 Tax=Fervidicoccus fontis TaxID=683846 RepID=A0A7C2UJY4_9CREN|nr:MAG: hypothetical protein C0179_08565 [Fervidicoccus sp.]HEU98122.1 hypothetical protein [Fervidicoccus fontis]